MPLAAPATPQFTSGMMKALLRDFGDDKFFKNRLAAQKINQLGPENISEFPSHVFLIIENASSIETFLKTLLLHWDDLLRKLIANKLDETYFPISNSERGQNYLPRSCHCPVYCFEDAGRNVELQSGLYLGIAQIIWQS